MIFIAFSPSVSLRSTAPSSEGACVLSKLKIYATVGTTLAVVRCPDFICNLLRTGASPVPTVQYISIRAVIFYYAIFGKAKRHSQSYAVDYFVLLNYRINSLILREIAVDLPIGYAHLILLPLTKLALEVFFVHMLAESLFDKRVACKFIHSVLKR